MRFTSGTIGSIHLDYINPIYNCDLELIGSAGVIRWNYQEHRIQWYLSNNKQLNCKQWPYYEGNQMYLDEIAHFIKALQGKETIEHDINEGIKDLRIAIAAKQSSIKRRAVSI